MKMWQIKSLSSGNGMKILTSKCRVLWLWNWDGEEDWGRDNWITRKEEKVGVWGVLGGSAPRKRDGLNRTRQRSQPAQQELSMCIWINPTNTSFELNDMKLDDTDSYCQKSTQLEHKIFHASKPTFKEIHQYIYTFFLNAQSEELRMASW